jgi:hypothetical protein
MHPKKHLLQNVVDLGLIGDTLRDERAEPIMDLLPEIRHRACQGLPHIRIH